VNNHTRSLEQVNRSSPSWETGNGIQAPIQPKAGKCSYCASKSRRCDGLYPFKTKCSTCTTDARRCFSQEAPPPPRLSLQPKAEKCFHCITYRRRCNGVRPFSTKCSACASKRLKCFAQGSTSIPDLPSESSLPKAEKCLSCLKRDKRCNGVVPFDNKCRNCMKNGLICRPQPTDPPAHPAIAYEAKHEKFTQDGTFDSVALSTTACEPCQNQSLDYRCSEIERERRDIKKIKHDLDEESTIKGPCHECRIDDRVCDGVPPFDNKCTRCIQTKSRCRAHQRGWGMQKLSDTEKCTRCKTDKASCYGMSTFEIKCPRCETGHYACRDQRVEPPMTIPKTERCQQCQYTKRKCSGERPCMPCVERRVVCADLDGQTRHNYALDYEQWQDDEESQSCQQCREKGSRDECDGAHPCNGCIRNNDSGPARRHCRYLIGGGIMVERKLQDNRVSKIRQRETGLARTRRDSVKKTSMLQA